MNTEHRTLNSVIFGVVALATLVVIWMTSQSYLRMQAVDQCGKMSQIQKNSDTERIQSPLLDIYNLCLKDKGIK